MSSGAGDLRGRIETHAAQVAGHFHRTFLRMTAPAATALTAERSRDIMMLMRTTLTLDDDIMKMARKRAAAESRPFKDVIDEALRLGLVGTGKRAPPTSVRKLTTFGGRGLQPGVRLDDRDALFDLMEGR